MPQGYNKRYMYAGIMGNILENYDTALFGLLAPFLSVYFFPTLDPITALILTYTILPLDILAKPLGAVIFGQLGDRWGRRYALSISISGTAIMTGLLGFVPTWNDIGLAAPLLLAFTRFLQKMCAGGESVGGAIYILEHQQGNSINLHSSIYGCSTVIGILIASILVSTASSYELVDSYWRYFFWIGFATSGIGLYIRLFSDETPEFETQKKQAGNWIEQSLWKQLWIHRQAFLAIILVSGFSYIIYEMSLVFLNGFMPLVSSASTAEVYKLNTIVLLLDIALLPVCGYLADRIGAQKQMLFASSAAFFCAAPLLMLSVDAGLSTLLLIRAIWVGIGVCFCAPFFAWTKGQIPIHCRYTLISLGYAIGSQLIGSPFSALALWTYKTTGLVYSPAFYIMGAALLAMFALQRAKATVKIASTAPAA